MMTNQSVELSPEAWDKLHQVSTATLTTQLLKRGFQNTFLQLTALLPDKHMVGYAFTLRYVPIREDLVDTQYDNDVNIQRLAVEAVNEGGSIHVKLFPKGDFIGIEISDTGRGIPEGDLGEIFDPFFSTKPDRTGINLTTAHRIIKEQGGTIQVSSQQGKGTSFSILLPNPARAAF